MTKRIISVLLALVLVLALAMPVLADDASTTYNLLIKDEAPNRTYTVYQIFSGVKSTDDQGSELLVEAKFGSDVDKAKLLNLLGLDEGATATEAVEKLAEKYKNDGKGAADDLAACLNATSTYEAKTTGDDKAGVTFTGLEYGYYFVKETTTLGATDDAVSAYILQIVGNTEVNTKRSDVPVVTKDQNEADKTYYIGKEITFTLNSAIPADVNYAEYDKYFFQFFDTMSNGLDFVKVESVKVAGQPDDNAIFKFEKSEDGKTLTWTCADTKGAGLAAGTPIEIKYVAKMNADAVVGGDGNPNTVKVIYSNNPETEGKGETTTDTEIVFCIDVDGFKIDGDTKLPLKGAKFVLKNAEGKFYKNTNGIVSWVDAQTDATEVEATGDNATFGFEGLEAGTYTLVETVIPKGYNKVADTPFEIKSHVEGDKVVFEDAGIIKLNADKDAVEMTVENNKGTQLPETGGIGTTIFYLVGGLMMAAAVVLLVAKKRTVNE